MADNDKTFTDDEQREIDALAQERSAGADEVPADEGGRTLAEKIMSDEPVDQPVSDQPGSGQPGSGQQVSHEQGSHLGSGEQADDQFVADDLMSDDPDDGVTREHVVVEDETTVIDEPLRDEPLRDEPLADEPLRDEPTQVVTAAGPVDEPTQVFDADSGEHTAVLDADEVARRDEERAEQERLAAARQADEQRRVQEAERQRRAEIEAERQRRLGTVTPRVDEEPQTTVVTTRLTDKFLGSFGLFLLRLVTAGIMGVHGFQKLTDIEGTTAFFTQLGLPQPGLVAWGVGIAEVLAAVALVFGFLVRFAGLGVAAVAIGALVLVKWGAANPFQAGQSGFVGELELLLAAVGIALAAVGGGGWGIDAGMRRGRARRKAGL